MVAMERWSRGDRRYGHTSRYYRQLPRAPLRGLSAVIAFAVCFLPIALGFLIPATALIGWTIENWSVAAGTPFLDLARHSLILAAIAAAICVLSALIIAYGLRLSGGRVALAASRVAAMGYAVPGSVIAVGVLLPCAWLDNRIDAFMRDTFGLSTGLLLSGTVIAMTYAYLVRFLGAALNPVEASLGRVTASMDGAARTLGVGPAATLRRVHAPLISGGLLTAALLVFVDVMKELPATLIMRPFNFDTLAVRAYQLAADERLAEAAAPSLAIVIVGLLPVIALSRAVARSRPGQTVERLEGVHAAG
jgi:iron(III) transport system permease protein